MALELELLLGVGNDLRDCFLASLLSVVSSNRDRTGIAGHQQQYTPNGCEVCHGKSSKFAAQDDLEHTPDFRCGICHRTDWFLPEREEPPRDPIAPHTKWLVGENCNQEVSKPFATCLGVYLGIFGRLGRFRVQQYFINDWKPEGLVVRLSAPLERFTK